MDNIIQYNNQTYNCLDYIDAILYINLAHRNDRKDHCLNEIKKIDKYHTKTYRIDAIYDKEMGARGCVASHIKALEYFIENKSWRNILILEDDFTFLSDNSYDIHKSICYLIENVKNYDVLLISYGINDLHIENTSNYNIKKVISSQTASGYIVNRNYINVLMNNFKESYNNLLYLGYKSEWCHDQSWKKLMPDGNWYTLKNRIGVQYDNYSDIEKKIVSYNC